MKLGILKASQLLRDLYDSALDVSATNEPGSFEVINGFNGSEIDIWNFHEAQGNWRERIAQSMTSAETLILEDFPLEEIAPLCLQHNYRWRFYNDRSPSDARFRFMVRPGPVSDPAETAAAAARH